MTIVQAVTLRLANPETDFPRIAELINLVSSEPVTVRRLHEEEKCISEGQIRRHSVAVNGANHIVGYSLIEYRPWEPTGHFVVWMVVDLPWRCQGIGASLYEDALHFARAQGATLLESDVREQQAEGLSFAEKRGFTIDRHIFESILDLSAFDEVKTADLAGLVKTVEATGIRFLSLADMGDTLDARRRLYELNIQAALDIPGSKGTYPTFEAFSQYVFEASWFRSEGQIMAVDADQVVGLAAVGYFEQTNSAYNMFTGINRAYRGRKLAQALKLLTIHYAQSIGAAMIRTNNDSQNAPMLKINRKLGYRPQPGFYTLLHRLA